MLDITQVDALLGRLTQPLRYESSLSWKRRLRKAVSRGKVKDEVQDVLGGNNKE